MKGDSIMSDILDVVVATPDIQSASGPSGDFLGDFLISTDGPKNDGHMPAGLENILMPVESTAEYQR